MIPSQFAPYGDLHKAVRVLRDSNNHLNLLEQVFLMVQMASALQYLEANGLVAREIALRDFLLSKCNMVKFGHFRQMRRLRDEAEFRAQLARNTLDIKVKKRLQPWKRSYCAAYGAGGS